MEMKAQRVQGNLNPTRVSALEIQREGLLNICTMFFSRLVSCVPPDCATIGIVRVPLA